jgi:hypothetical protein
MSDYDAISQARSDGIDDRNYADITNLPPGYIEGFTPTLDTDYHVTFTAGSTSVEGRQVTINESHQIVDEDFVGTRLGPYFYYVYLSSVGDYKVDRAVPSYSDQYLYYAHPVFNWRAIGKLWVDDADDDIKYVTDKVVGVSTTVTVAAFDSDEIVDADYQCTGTNDHIFVDAAISFLDGAYGGGEILLGRGEFYFAGDPSYSSTVIISGQGPTTSINYQAGSNGFITQNDLLFRNFKITNDGIALWTFLLHQIGVPANQFTGIVFENITFVGGVDSVIESMGDSCKSIGCTFLGFSTVAITTQSGSNDVLVSGCVFDGNGATPASTTAVIISGEATVSGCTFRNLESATGDCIGLLIGGDESRVVDCYFFNLSATGGNAIGMDIISNNAPITSNSFDTMDIGINIQATADSTKVVGNTFTGVTDNIADAGTNTDLIGTNDGTIFGSQPVVVRSADPTTELQIDNTAVDGDPYLSWALSGTNTFTMGVDDGDSDKLKIGTTAIGTNTRLTINSSGNVGIGTSSPDGLLHLLSSNTTSTDLYIENTSTGGKKWRIFSSGNAASIGAGDLAFRDETAGAYRMLIDSGGNVGIGTSSPDETLQVVGSTKLGDDNTNYMLVESDGDVVFVGGSGLAFGSMYTNSTIAVTLTDANTWYEIDGATAWTGGEEHNCTFTDPEIDVTYAGMYDVSWDLSIDFSATPGTKQEVEGGIMVNGSIVLPGRGHRTLANSTDTGSFSGHAILDLSAGDDVSIALNNNTSGGKILHAEHGNLVIKQIGGT